MEDPGGLEHLGPPALLQPARDVLGKDLAVAPAGIYGRAPRRAQSCLEEGLGPSDTACTRRPALWFPTRNPNRLVLRFICASSVWISVDPIPEKKIVKQKYVFITKKSTMFPLY